MTHTYIHSVCMYDKVPYLTLNLSVSLCNYFTFYFMYFEVTLLNLYVIRIARFSMQIPFSSLKYYHSLMLLNLFALNAILSFIKCYSTHYHLHLSL